MAHYLSDALVTWACMSMLPPASSKSVDLSLLGSMETPLPIPRKATDSEALVATGAEKRLSETSYSLSLKFTVLLTDQWSKRSRPYKYHESQTMFLLAAMAKVSRPSKIILTVVLTCTQYSLQDPSNVFRFGRTLPDFEHSFAPETPC